MKDFIPKGTGNSRYLKSGITAGTTWEQFKAMLIAGTAPIDLNGLNAAGIQQMGTALSVANLFKGSTAALLGLTADAVPDDAFKELASASKIVTGSYVGTGTFGSGNPNVIKTGFTPKFGVVVDVSYSYAYGVFVYGCTTTSVSTASTASIATTTWNSDGISFYGAAASDQFNMPRTYYYVFFG